MRRILIISPNFHPEKTGIGVTATDCARFIQQLGNDVTVVTAVPYYPEWKIHKEYQGKLFCNEEFENVKVKRVWLYVPRKVVTWKRIAHELSFAALVFVRSLFTPCDLIILISPPLSAAGVAVAVSKLRRKKLWCYVKDIQPDAAICLGMLKNKYLIGFSKWLEKTLYQASEKVLVLSQGMRSNLAKKGVPPEKLEIVPDSIEVSELTPDPATLADPIFRAEFGLEEKFLAVYSGNIGVKQNPEILVQCAKALQNYPDVFIAVVGEGALRDRISEQIAELKLTNIAVYPLRERRLLGDMLSSADVLLAPQRKEVRDIVMPSKLIAYLTSSRPVIASAHEDSEVARELSQHSAGIVCPPEDVQALVDAILKLRAEPKTAAALGAAGRQYVLSTFDHAVVKERFYRPLFGEPVTLEIPAITEIREEATVSANADTASAISPQ